MGNLDETMPDSYVPTRSRTSLDRPAFRHDLESNLDSSTSRSEDTTETIPPQGSIEAILEERGHTHGDFTDNARVMQALKRIIHAEVGWDKLTDVQREALHMILHKIGRIITGNPDVHDHWDDIAGYAKLTSERIVIT